MTTLTLPELERIWDSLDTMLQSIHDQLRYTHDAQDLQDLESAQAVTERLQHKIGGMIDGLRVRPTKDDVEFTLEAVQDYTRPGDELDESLVEEINRRLNEGDPWAWASVTVTAHWTNPVTGAEHQGQDFLGGCCYKSAEDFVANSGYYDDMREEAYRRLIESLTPTEAHSE